MHKCQYLRIICRCKSEKRRNITVCTSVEVSGKLQSYRRSGTPRLQHFCPNLRIRLFPVSYRTVAEISSGRIPVSTGYSSSLTVSPSGSLNRHSKMRSDAASSIDQGTYSCCKLDRCDLKRLSKRNRRQFHLSHIFHPDA